MKMRILLTVLWIAAFCSPGLSAETESAASSLILIKNVRVFDGRSETLTPAQDVLVEGNLIRRIGRDLAVPADARVINGQGRTLTPGFIDAHVHLQWNTGVYELLDSPPDYHAALALVEAKNTLMRGYFLVS